MATTVGSLLVSLGLDSSQFKSGLTQAEKKMAQTQSSFNKIGGQMKGAFALLGGAAIVGGLTTIATDAFAMGSALTEAASKVGVTVEALQEMRFVAEQNGVSIETMDGSLNKMSKTLGELQLKNPAVSETFKQLGLSAQQMIGLTPTESFTKIVEALGKVEDETVRAALGNKVFGRSYAELKPLVDLGADGIRKAAEEKRKDGIISTEQAAKLDELADGWARLQAQVGVATAQLIANTAASGKASGGIDGITKSITNAIDDIATFIGWVRSAELALLKLQRVNLEQSLSNPLVQMIPSMGQRARQNLNDTNAQIQQYESNPGGRKGVRGGGGQSPIKGWGGAAAASMAGLGSVDVGGALDSLDKKSDKLEKVTTPKIERSAKKIKTALETLTEKVQPLMDRLFPEVKQLLEYKADKSNLQEWANKGKIGVDTLQQAFTRLRDEFYDIEVPQGIVQIPDLIDNISDNLPPMSGVVVKTAAEIQAANVRIVKSFKDVADETLASVSNFANAVKGGGIVGILEGLLGLFTQLGSIGAFGKGLQASINAPARANGGPVSAGRTYMVGERGPELWTAKRSGSIIPNHALGGAGGSTVRIIPSPYFNAVVDQRASGVAAPMAARAAMAGSQIAEQRIGKSRKNRIP